MRKSIQFLCGVAVFAAFGFSWLWTLPFVNRVTIHQGREKYRPGTYLVTGAEYHRGDEGDDSWWLTGTIASHEERFIPRVSKGQRPRNQEEVLARFPKGTKIDVFYNPDATEMIVQDETLRVIEATPNFWQEEARRQRSLGQRVLVPVPLALALYLTVRYANRRHARLQRQSVATQESVSVSGSPTLPNRPKTPSQSVFLMGRAFVLIGTLIAVVGAVWLLHTCWFVSHAARAAGIIVQLDVSTDSEGGTSYYPVFSFTDTNGSTFTRRSEIGSGYFKFNPGDKVSILYSLENPEKCNIETFVTVWMPPLIAIGFGTLFGGFAVLWMTLARRVKVLVEETPHAG